MKRFGYTLAEIVIVMLIIAVIVGVSIKVTKSRLDNVISYTYYSTYSTLRSVTSNMLADYNPNDDLYKSFLRVPLIGRLLSAPVYAEKAQLYTCPYYATYDIWSNGTNMYGTWTSGDALIRKSKSDLNCSYNEALNNIRNTVNNTTGEHSYMVCSGTRGGHSTYGTGPGYTTSDTSKNCTYDCSTGNSHYVGGGNCGPHSLLKDSAFCNSVLYSFELQSGICVHEYECPEGTYVKYGTDEYSTIVWDASQGKGVTKYLYHDKYTCVSYKTCPDGSQVKQDETCPESGVEPETPETPVCNITPTDSEISSQYCLGKEFDSTPEVCGWVNINPWPPACETGKEWSAENCKCIAIPATIPKKGANFCELFERLVNISPTDSVCDGSTVNADTTEFSDLTPDLILRNGVRLYNVHKDPDLIPQLRIVGQDDETSEKDMNQQGYIVYADVDGSKGNSILWEDVYPFYITLSGRVIPAYDSEANPDGSGGDSENHLQVSVKNETYSSNGHRIMRWLSKSVSFKEGGCQSGYVNSSTPYCGGLFYNNECSSGNSSCQLKIIRPLKFF